MTSIICSQCGTHLDQTALACSVCGTVVSPNIADSSPSTDPREEQLRALIEKARTCAQTGDVATALRYARNALSQRTTCSTTHALLGQLYEQQGDLAAARYHFQAALNIVEPSDPHPSEVSAPRPIRQPQAGLVLLVLIGCILFSGLAALFVFRPANPVAELEAVEVIPHRLPRNEEPRWTWKVPDTVPMSEASTPAIAASSASTISNDPTGDAPHDPALSQTDTVKETTTPPERTVLGPSVRHHGAATVSNKPSLESADQAFFRGEYDKAVTLYESLLLENAIPDPRIYHDLAWCYQQLGNSPKASEYLLKAIQGYHNLLTTEPNNAAAQQGLDSCRAALRALTETRESELTP